MGKDILFISNSTERRNSFYQIFTSQGHKVTTTSQVPWLLKVIKDFSPHYIILDIDFLNLDPNEFEQEAKAIDRSIEMVKVSKDDSNFEVARELLGEDKKRRDIDLPGFPKGTFEGKILIVDDEKYIVELIKDYLERKGYEVDTALDGEEAIFKLESRRPKIVLLDIYMKGMDGLVALKRIKDIDPSVGVIITSALRCETTVREALKLGAVDYLAKPFNLEELEKRILNMYLKEIK
jgi:DNA-binding response OmpR family regulator